MSPVRGHVFLSYQCDSKFFVVGVKEYLEKHGYVVWLDVEMMQDEMNKRMAEAVEGAAVVCPVISNKYAESRNCIKELNYSDQRRRHIVPIIFDPDVPARELLPGQVGIITAAQIYIDFSSLFSSLSTGGSSGGSTGGSTDSTFEHKMEELMSHLGNRGKEEEEDDDQFDGNDLNEVLLGLVQRTLKSISYEAQKAKENKEALIKLAGNCQLVQPKIDDIRRSLDDCSSQDKKLFSLLLSDLFKRLQSMDNIVAALGKPRSSSKFRVPADTNRDNVVFSKIRGAEMNLMRALKLLDESIRNLLNRKCVTETDGEDVG